MVKRWCGASRLAVFTKDEAVVEKEIKDHGDDASETKGTGA